MYKFLFWLWLFIWCVQPKQSIAQTLESTSQEFLIRTISQVDFKQLIEKIKTTHPLIAPSIEMVRCIAPTLSVWCVRYTNRATLPQFLTALHAFPAVTDIQTNHLLTKPRGRLISDPLYTQQWQLVNDNINQNTLDIDIDAEEAWQINTGGYTTHQDTIVVAVIDEGVLDSHPDLTHNIWRNTHEIPDNGIDDDQNGWIDDVLGWNFKTNTNNVNNDGIGHWHGTPVAGIIGAEGNNGIGISGVNWRIKLMSLVKGQDEASIIAAYDYILTMRKKYNESGGKQGAFVVVAHASWGVDSLKAADAPLWCAIYDELGKVGVLSVAATTNNNTNVDTEGDMPTTCTSNYLVTVTNTNNFDEKITGAGYGKQSIDLAAPGFNSFTTLNTGTYGVFGGTSAAAPYVSGAIALLYAMPANRLMDSVKAAPAQTALRLKQCILAGVDPVAGLQAFTVSGGRLNLYGSIQQLSAYYGLHQSASILGSLNAYPNPIKEHLFLKVSLTGATRLTIQITNLSGKTIKSRQLGTLPQGIHRIRLEMAHLPNGIYLCVVQGSAGRQVIKLIKK